MNMFKHSKATTAEEYISLLDEPRKSAILTIHNFIRETVPNLSPFIQSGMIGYGKMPYKTKSGITGDWFLIGLASQKNYISLYSCATQHGKYLTETYKDLLGKASIGKSCIRYKKIEDIPWDSLKKLLRESESIGKTKGIFQ